MLWVVGDTPILLYFAIDGWRCIHLTLLCRGWLDMHASYSTVPWVVGDASIILYYAVGGWRYTLLS